MAQDDAQNSTNGSSILLSGRIEIYPSIPLSEYNSSGGLAYAARLKSDPSSNFYAIVCQSLTPRLDAIASMRNIDNPGIIRFIDSGVITWLDGSRVYAFVFQKPVAPRMMNSLEETHPLISEDSVNHHFITPMINSLVVFDNFGLVHNAIRPTNIFWRIGTPTPPQIGECLSMPAGVGQPIVFAPLERAMAMPLGRGVGLITDDCYAFGMTLAFLVMGRNPFAGMSDEAIIDLKLQRGSFSATVGNYRLSPTHIEILRGLLADDSRQRWSPTDLDQWQNGRRMTPKSSEAGKRSARFFEFGGKEYWQVAPLAAALAANIPEANKVIENESLNKWLRRALNDEDRAREVERVIKELKQTGKVLQFEEQIVARVCIALDRSAPIRYRGLSVMPAGIATLLADAAQTGNNVSALSEIIASQLVSLWIEMQKDSKVDYIALSQLFDRMKSAIEKSSYGNGIERATYEANPALPCLSPILRNQYVMSPKMLLAALERVAAGGARPREPMDRHIAAFLLVRERRGESFFAPLAAPEGSLARGLALLNLYAEMQYKHGPEHLPHLASWLAPTAEPAIRRFLSKSLREHMQKQVKEAVNSGNLALLMQLIDDPRRIERDMQDFNAARVLYMNIQNEITHLEAKLNSRDSIVRSSGKPMAATISSFLAIILIFAAVLRALLSALFF